jgi:hypothetical protein
MRKMICRVEAEAENGLPASATDWPKDGELRFPTGVARPVRLTMLSAIINSDDIMTLRGLTAGGEPEDLGQSLFRVVKE